MADGSLTRAVPGAQRPRLARGGWSLGEAVAFGPGHVHDVAHGGDTSATSIHAYSPPLSAMTYYSATDYGLIARETVAIDGPEGARGRGGADTALARATASAARLTSDALPDGAPGIDELLAEARSGLTRLRPEAAFAAMTDGAVLVDIRPLEQRIVEGEVPGRHHHRPQRAGMAARPAQRGPDPGPGPARRAGDRDVLAGYASSLAASLTAPHRADRGRPIWTADSRPGRRPAAHPARPWAEGRGAGGRRPRTVQACRKNQWNPSGRLSACCSPSRPPTVPATDLGFLLHKHPDRVQEFDAVVRHGDACSTPRPTDERCTAALLLDVDPVRLARCAAGNTPDFSPRAVRQRPARTPRRRCSASRWPTCSARPGPAAATPVQELADRPIPLEIALPVLPCRGGPELAHRLFEPLGWEVEARADPARRAVPRVGRLALRPAPADRRRCGWPTRSTSCTCCCRCSTTSKHYWQGADEVDKLLRSGGAGWPAHPEQELITRRYLGRSGALTRAALARLAELGDDAEEALEPPDDEEAAAAGGGARPAQHASVTRPCWQALQELEAARSSTSAADRASSCARCWTTRVHRGRGRRRVGARAADRRAPAASGPA